MTQIATVRKLNENGLAEVFVQRKTACGHDCSDCAGCTQVITGETVVSVPNVLDARQGDVVLLESQTSTVLKAAMVVYILPFALFFVGYFLAAVITGVSEGAIPVIAGLIGFLAGVLTAVLRDRRERKSRSLQYRMVEIKQRCLDM